MDRLERQYKERFGEGIPAEMVANAYEKAEKALEMGEPIEVPNPPPGTDISRSTRRGSRDRADR